MRHKSSSCFYVFAFTTDSKTLLGVTSTPHSHSLFIPLSFFFMTTESYALWLTSRSREFRKTALCDPVLFEVSVSIRKFIASFLCLWPYSRVVRHGCASTSLDVHESFERSFLFLSSLGLFSPLAYPVFVVLPVVATTTIRGTQRGRHLGTSNKFPGFDPLLLESSHPGARTCQQPAKRKKSPAGADKARFITASRHLGCPRDFSFSLSLVFLRLFATERLLDPTLSDSTFEFYAFSGFVYASCQEYKAHQL